MEKYRKPVITNYDDVNVNGLIPAIAGLSAAKLLAVGAAMGLAASKGVVTINSKNTSTLTARKDFALE